MQTFLGLYQVHHLYRCQIFPAGHMSNHSPRLFTSVQLPCPVTLSHSTLVQRLMVRGLLWLSVSFRSHFHCSFHFPPYTRSSKYISLVGNTHTQPWLFVFKPPPPHPSWYDTHPHSVTHADRWSCAALGLRRPECHDISLQRCLAINYSWAMDRREV